MKLDKSFSLGAIFFLLAFSADAAITSFALSLGASEGNEIVVWLWSIFGTDSLLLKIIYVFLVLGISVFVFRRRYVLGLAMIYSFAFGHLLGFLTWVTFLNMSTVHLIAYAIFLGCATSFLIIKLKTN